MKNAMLIASFFMAFVFTVPVVAQTTKKIKKEIKGKAIKEARKEAKKLAKEGFAVAPGQLPMDKQIESVWFKRYETDDNGNPAYFVADARSVGETHSAAKLQAYEVAKINLAGQIGVEVAGLVETTLANAQLNAEDAASVTETVATFKSLVGSKMGRTLTLFEASRTIDKNTEVTVTLGYNYETAVEMAKNVLRDEMKAKAKINAKQLDQILDF